MRALETAKEAASLRALDSAEEADMINIPSMTNRPSANVFGIISSADIEHSSAHLQSVNQLLDIVTI